jgi:hypothetical protein
MGNHQNSFILFYGVEYIQFIMDNLGKEVGMEAFPNEKKLFYTARRL